VISHCRERQGVASKEILKDSVLRGNILAQLQSEPWWPGGVNVIVHDGVVELWGIVEFQIQKDAIRVALEATPGVRTISDNITVQRDVPHVL